MSRTNPENIGERLNRSVALLKQYYEALVQICPLHDMSQRVRDSESQRQAIENLLSKIHTHHEIIEEILGAVVSNESPFVELQANHADFYHKEYIPNRGALDTLYWDSFLGFFDLGDLQTQEPTPSPPQSSEQPILLTIQASLESQEWRAEDNPDWPSAITDFDGASQIASAGYFSPDIWLENQKELKPIISDRAARDYPTHIRIRIKEIFRSFIFGNWLSVYAMSRSLVEYALIDRATVFNVEPHEIMNGKKRIKRLTDLIDAYKTPCPTLADTLDSVREFGNQAMHPSKKNKIVRFPHIMRDDSLKCIDHATQVIAHLYSKTAASE